MVYKNENLTESHSRYLESRLLNISKLSGRSILINSNEPDYNNLPEPDKADMEYFIDRCRLIFPVVGVDILHTKATSATTYSDQNSGDVSGEFVEFEIDGVNVQAKMKIVEGEFIVLKGSRARKIGTPSWVTTYSKKARDKIIESGLLKLEEGGEYYVFVDDVAFKTPTAAAEAVLARSENGRTGWKLKNSKLTLAQWEQSVITKVENSNDSATPM